MESTVSGWQRGFCSSSGIGVDEKERASIASTLVGVEIEENVADATRGVSWVT